MLGCTAPMIDRIPPLLVPEAPCVGGTNASASMLIIRQLDESALRPTSVITSLQFTRYPGEPAQAQALAARHADRPHDAASAATARRLLPLRDAISPLRACAAPQSRRHGAGSVMHTVPVGALNIRGCSMRPRKPANASSRGATPNGGPTRVRSNASSGRGRTSNATSRGPRQPRPRARRPIPGRMGSHWRGVDRGPGLGRCAHRCEGILHAAHSRMQPPASGGSRPTGTRQRSPVRHVVDGAVAIASASAKSEVLC